MVKDHVLYDTTEKMTYEDYVEFCELNDIEPSSEDSNDFNLYVSDMSSLYWDDFKLNLENSSKNEQTVFVIGTLGLWTGHHTIIPVRFNSRLEAIMKCISNMDDFKIEVKDGILTVTAHHHDGTNIFQIVKLNKEGMKIMNKIDEDIEDYPEIQKDWIEVLDDYLF